MKILPNHPEFYLKYKDQKINVGPEGIVVGYYLEDNGDPILIIQINEIDDNKRFNDFITRYSINLKDYHGNPNMHFFLADEKFIYT